MKILDIAISFALLVSGIIADESVHIPFAEYQTVISQKLETAQNKNDETLLQDVATFRKGEKYVNSNGVTQLRYKPEEVFPVRLQILQVADKMQDKSYDRDGKPKSGLYDNVPWPPENERPEALRGKPLWWPRTPPEYYKEKNPKLYAFYKPLYEENQRNTRKYLREAHIRVIRTELLELIKRSLKIECDRGKDSRYFDLYLHLVDEIIKDEQLRDEILSDLPPERRLPEKVKETEANQ